MRMAPVETPSSWIMRNQAIYFQESVAPCQILWIGDTWLQKHQTTRDLREIFLPQNPTKIIFSDFPTIDFYLEVQPDGLEGQAEHNIQYSFFGLYNYRHYLGSTESSMGDFHRSLGSIRLPETYEKSVGLQIKLK